MNLDWREVWSNLSPSIGRIADQIKALEQYTKTPQQRALLSIIREITEEKGAINLNYILEKIEITFGCSVVIEPRNKTL